jgi:hypothetical protein
MGGNRRDAPAVHPRLVAAFEPVGSDKISATPALPIEQTLETDRQAPRKQRHTAHRIWSRLREEHAEFSIGEPTVRRYVAQRSGN